MNIDEKEEKDGEMAGTSQDGPGLGAADSRSPGQGAAIGTGSGVSGQNAGAGSQSGVPGWHRGDDSEIAPAPDADDGWKIPEQKPKGSWKKELWEWVKIILSAAVIAFVLNTFIIANSQVPSGSMENTIMTGDRVIGSRLSYLLESPERGDIVIFHFPDNEKIYYVKRIIGLPGDTVDIVDGKVYLNGSPTPLEEDYIREPMVPEPPMHFEVPEDSYFMLGDNRNYSADARRWTNTYVKRKKIVAKVLFRCYPGLGKIE